MMDLFVPRKCEDCNLCCKLPEIPSINKKSYSWCKSCDIGIGCKIYDNKPKKCNEFSCAYLEQFTDLINVRLRGRSFNMKLESTAQGVAWKLGTPRVDIRQDGRR